MTRTLNASAYRFVELDDVAGWRTTIEAEARRRGLKGTVLLAPEGINLSLAGAPDALSGFMTWLGAHPPFAGLAATETESDRVPFRRLGVKVKREIIRMNRGSIAPQRGRAPAVDAATLGRWLDAGLDDAGHPIAILDTRNAFEVDAGRIKGALDWRLGRFSEFPEALAANRAALRGKTVVAYCTGGIRCEKAALEMVSAGLDRVYQLEGGILALLRASGSTHYDGHCVVFDERGAVDTALRPRGASDEHPSVTTREIAGQPA
ncbi:sulfurtransferase [Piscinibacter koreensis]|uniref:Sulfurtransferase n=1 Tax=Piscinibacter koreensis TaxID=2742824 RepID=A0A7Y6NPW3_9BURK|nr:sulfurtransferase [Schlegelella koreensis]